MSATRCPCLSGDTYDVCCARFHSGATQAPTAEQLMRSRYAAFAVGDPGYLTRTWHPSTRPEDLELDDDVRWTRLDVLSAVAGGPFDAHGVVEFVAHYRQGTNRGRMHEVSTFTRDDGRWLYVGPTA
ncbi:YchJ family protein [Cellulomonas bogoriensis]|uniref:UPF0225 protein N869_09865 n=1 Tax=Cellulomonas bogoriensis 69B4 = DSM 16987 TaxID=1386082 RepID=A0A0A0BLH4_9CELL|nr:YchJ family protein [Cellulomonas bogoriensis]KGM08796.1 zinc-binding protein [Cellulomonas bogoriensis 69B4 = DSM 16987]